MSFEFGDYVECNGHVVVFQSDGRKFVEVSPKNVTMHQKEFREGSIVVCNSEIGKITHFHGGYGKPFVSFDRERVGCSGSESFLDMRLATIEECQQYEKECVEVAARKERQKIADVATETLLAELSDRLKTKQ